MSPKAPHLALVDDLILVGDDAVVLSHQRRHNFRIGQPWPLLAWKESLILVELAGAELRGGIPLLVDAQHLIEPMHCRGIIVRVILAVTINERDMP